VSLALGGIGVSGNNNVVRYNSMMNLSPGAAAIGFNCTGTSNTVTHNLINEAAFGITGDPGGNLVAPNSFSNVKRILSPC
jgi:hypothetical protein